MQDCDDFNKRQQFIRSALPTEWLGYAEDLADAAEALWAVQGDGQCVAVTQSIDRLTGITRETAHARSYMLLVGLALENALKAYLVTLDPRLINTGELDRSLHTHSLMTLASRLPITLSDEEVDVLEKCQEAVPYWGRYPIPLTYRKLSPAHAASAEFRATAKQLHYRIGCAIHALVRDGWDSGAGPRTIKVRNKKYGDTMDDSEPSSE